MKFLDKDHKQLIETCVQKGHVWTDWENTKFVTGSERMCTRCKLHVNVVSGKPPSRHYAVGSVWPHETEAIAFINKIASNPKKV